MCQASRKYLKTIVCPRAKFHFASLVIEREPSDVDFTCWLKDARRNVQAWPIISYHNVCWIRPIKSFIGTVKKLNKGCVEILCVEIICYVFCKVYQPLIYLVWILYVPHIPTNVFRVYKKKTYIGKQEKVISGLLDASLETNFVWVFVWIL